MQLGHAVSARALPAHHADHVAVQLARLERHLQCVLRIKHPTRRFDDMALHRNRRHFDYAASQIARQQLEPAAGAEGLGRRTHHAVVAAGAGLDPGQAWGRVRPLRNTGECAQAIRAHGAHIGVHQACVQQLANHKTRTACGLELVHVGAAIGVHTGQQRHHVGERREIVPINHHAARPGYRHPMDQVVG